MVKGRTIDCLSTSVLFVAHPLGQPLFPFSCSFSCSFSFRVLLYSSHTLPYPYTVYTCLAVFTNKYRAISMFLSQAQSHVSLFTGYWQNGIFFLTRKTPFFFKTALALGVCPLSHLSKHSPFPLGACLSGNANDCPS